MSDVGRRRDRSGMSRTVSATSTRRLRDSGSPVVMGIDVVLIVIAGALAAWPFADAYAGHRWLIAALVGLLLGALIAWVGHELRLGAWSSAALLVLVYFAFGPGLAVPDLASSGVGPNVTAVRALLHGSVESWRDALTAPVPLGSAAGVLIVPLIASLLAGVLAGTALWRSRWPAVAALPLGALFVTAAAYGDIDTAYVVIRGLALGVVLVVWFRLRALRHVQARWGRRLLLTSAVVALASGAAVGGAAVMASDPERRVLRDHVEPPFDPQDYPSPLSKFRSYVNSDVAKAKQLFSVQGLPKGAQMRVATMDYYDGVVWNVAGGEGSTSDSGTFRRLRSDARSSSDSHSVSVTILDPDYQDPWVPTIGQTQTVEVVGSPGEALDSLVYNRETGTLASTRFLVPGSTYRMSSELPTQPKRDAIAVADIDGSASTPTPEMVPDELVSRVKEWQGNDEFTGGAAGSWALFLQDALKNKGFFTDGDGNVPAGHGYSRLALLTRPNTQPLGNDEQYAAAMALAAQSIRNLPARVVLGFRTPADSMVSPVTVEGRDMAAWVEVKLDGYGWVSFDPTPPDQQILQRPKEEPNDDPQPQVLQPPQPPGEPKEAGANLQQGDSKKSKFDLWGLVGDIVAVLVRVGQLLLLTLPLWGILLYKALRRRRRRRAVDPGVRLSGGWRDFTDRARDLGVALPESNTRQENGQLLEARFPDSGSVALATRADAQIFGPSVPDDEVVDAYWADVRSASRRLPRSRPWWRRIWAWFSPASVPWPELRRRAKARRQRFGNRIKTIQPTVTLHKVREFLRRKLKVKS